MLWEVIFIGYGKAATFPANILRVFNSPLVFHGTNLIQIILFHCVHGLRQSSPLIICLHFVDFFGWSGSDFGEFSLLGFDFDDGLCGSSVLYFFGFWHPFRFSREACLAVEVFILWFVPF